MYLNEASNRVLRRIFGPTRVGLKWYWWKMVVVPQGSILGPLLFLILCKRSTKGRRQEFKYDTFSR